MEAEIVTYEKLKTELLNKKCLSCHFHKMTWKDEAGFQQRWIKLGDPDNSQLFESVKLGRMPKAPDNDDGTPGEAEVLSTEELEIIRNYIENALPLTP